MSEQQRLTAEERQRAVDLAHETESVGGNRLYSIYEITRLARAVLALDAELRDAHTRLALMPNADDVLQICHERDAALAEMARLREALRFYSRHEHWMDLTEYGDMCRLLVANGRHNMKGDGWEEAEAALSTSAPSAEVVAAAMRLAEAQLAWTDKGHNWQTPHDNLRNAVDAYRAAVEKAKQEKESK